MTHKKILVLLPFAFYRTSGSSFSSYFRIKALLEIGNKVEVISYPHGEDLKLPGLKITRIPKNKIFKEHQAGEYKKKILYDLLIFVSTFRKLFNGNYDVVIAHGSTMFFIIFFKAFIRSKFVANLHGNLEVDLVKWKVFKNTALLKVVGRIESFFVNKYDALICEHKSVINILLNNGIKHKHKLFLIPISMSVNKYTNNSNGIDNGFENTFNILYTGTFVNVQNLELLYEAANQLKDQGVSFTVIGGTIEEIEKEKIKIDKNPAYTRENIEFVERQKYDGLNKYFEKCDIVISPREYGFDTPMKIFDYMNRGKCILATNKPIHTEVLNTKNSYLFEPTVKDLINAVVFLKSNFETRKKLAIKAKHDFESSHSFDIMKNKYKDFFCKLFSKLEEPFEKRTL